MQGYLFDFENSPAVWHADGELTTLPVKDHPATFEASKRCFGGMGFPIEMLFGPVSSNGLVVGSNKAMREYINAMVSGFMDYASPECVKQHGADQAIHTMLMNVLANQKDGLKFSIIKLQNGVSPYYSMTEARPVQMDMFGVVSVVRGSWGFHPVYIHGYNR